MKITDLKFVVFIFMTVLFTFSDANIAWSQEVLTNATIIKLSKVGLSDALIIGKIKTSTDKFNTTVDSMIYLKEQGVSSVVINFMDSVSAIKADNDYYASHLNDPSFMHPSGIYYYNPSDPKNPLTKIEANKVSGASGSGYSVYGFSGSSLVYTLTGEEAAQQINNSNPVFYFYFNPHQSTGESFDATFLTSPNSFTLVSLNISNHKRYFGAGSSSSGGLTANSSRGINPKNICEFNFRKIDEGIYEVTLKSSKKLGEYAFTATGEHGSDMILFDWGIDLH